MKEYIIYIAVILVLVLFSGYFSATETAFTSLNRIKIKNMPQNRRTRLVLQLEDRYDKVLSTILIGNNIVNIAMTAIATVLFIKLCGSIGATWSTIVMTVIVLIFGEIWPPCRSGRRALRRRLSQARYRRCRL